MKIRHLVLSKLQYIKFNTYNLLFNSMKLVHMIKLNCAFYFSAKLYDYCMITKQDKDNMNIVRK